MTDDKITLIGPSQDRTIVHLSAQLEKRGIEFTLLPLDRLFQNGRIEVSPMGAQFRWDDHSLALPFSRRRIFSRIILPARPSSKTLAQKRVLTAFLQRAEGIIINRPLSGVSNYSKVVQLIQFHQSGATVPETLLTNIPRKLQSFKDEHQDIIYKSPSSIRSIVMRLDGEAESRIKHLHKSPVLFQDHVEGKDVRVHVIGELCVSEEITSTSVDYRYDETGQTAYRPIELPVEIERMCVELTKLLGLNFSGIDFKVDQQGNYWVLEVNPMPGYEDYDIRSDFLISDALIDYLALP